MNQQSQLAIDGGTAVRSTPLPPRHLIGQEEKAAAMKLFDDALESGNAFGYGGAAEQQYEKDFVEGMGGGFANAVNSGTNAVFCALGALQLEPFSEVIAPANTDPGGVMPIVFVGCVPVVADTDPRTYNITAEEIEPMISERTRAIIVAHIAGDPADMDPIMELARRHDLLVIEDCAQAQKAMYKRRPVGTIGDIATFSTMFGKHYCTGGQGGVVYSTHEELHWQGRRFSDRGKPLNLGTLGNVTCGLNCNLNDLSAAIGCVQLNKLPAMIAQRRRIAEAIHNSVANSRIISPAWTPPESEPSYWFLRLRFNAEACSVDKHIYCDALAAEGIEVVADYRQIPVEGPWFKNRAGLGTSGFPWTCSDYKGPKEPQCKIDNLLVAITAHINITIHESYGDNEIDDIIAAIEKLEKAYS